MQSSTQQQLRQFVAVIEAPETPDPARIVQVPQLQEWCNAAADSAISVEVLRRLVVLHANSLDVAVKCVCLTTATAIAIDTLILQGFQVPTQIFTSTPTANGLVPEWLQELAAPIAVLLGNDANRMCRPSDLSFESLNATAVHCAHELESVFPGLVYRCLPTLRIRLEEQRVAWSSFLQAPRREGVSIGSDMVVGPLMALDLLVTTNAVTDAAYGGDRELTMEAQGSSGDASGVVGASSSSWASGGCAGSGAAPLIRQCGIHRLTRNHLGVPTPVAKRRLVESLESFVLDSDQDPEAQEAVQRLFTSFPELVRAASHKLKVLDPIAMSSAVMLLSAVCGYESLGFDAIHDTVQSALRCSVDNGDDAAICFTGWLTKSSVWTLLQGASEVAKRPPYFIPCSDRLPDERYRSYCFSHGKLGTGMYLLDTDIQLHQTQAITGILPVARLLSSSVMAVADREIFAFANLLSEPRAANSSVLRQSLTQGVAWDSPQLTHHRLVTAAMAAPTALQAALGALRTVRGKRYWGIPAVRSTVITTTLHMMLVCPAAHAPLAAMLSSCGASAVLSAFDALMNFAREAEQAALKHAVSPVGTPVSPSNPDFGTPTKPPSSKLSFIGGTNNVHIEGFTHAPAVSALAVVLERLALDTLVNQTAQSLVRALPIVLRALQTSEVQRKTTLLEHLTARIPDVDNSWYAGNLLLMCIRAYALGAEDSDVANPLVSATVTVDALHAMRAHFSDAAIAAQVELLLSVLGHLPASSIRYLLEVADGDEDDIIAFCNRKGGADVPMTGTSAITVSLDGLQAPFYLNNKPDSCGSEEMPLTFTVSVPAGGECLAPGAALRLYTDGLNRDAQLCVLTHPLPVIPAGESFSLSVTFRVSSSEPALLFASCCAPQRPPVHLPEVLEIGFERYLRRRAAATSNSGGSDALASSAGADLARCPHASRRLLCQSEWETLSKLIKFEEGPAATLASWGEQSWGGGGGPESAHRAVFDVAPSELVVIEITHEPVDLLDGDDEDAIDDQVAASRDWVLRLAASSWRVLSLLDNMFDTVLTLGEQQQHRHQPTAEVRSGGVSPQDELSSPVRARARTNTIAAI